MSDGNRCPVWTTMSRGGESPRSGAVGLFPASPRDAAREMMTKKEGARIKIWVTRSRKTETCDDTKKKRDDVYGVRLGEERQGEMHARMYVCTCTYLHACLRVYTILNPPGKRARRDTMTRRRPFRWLYACVSRTHTCTRDTYTHVRARARNTSHVCSGRENRPRRAKRVRVIRRPGGAVARYRTICLENNGNARRGARERGWIFRD